MQFSQRDIPAKKRIALVAHDNRKQDLLSWVLTNKSILEAHEMHATGTTGGLLSKHLDVPIGKFLSGPMGGDQQIGGAIAEGKIDVLIFFWDPFEPMPHDPDVKALLRIAAVWNIPVACNQASADLLVQAPQFSQVMSVSVPDYGAYQTSRDD